MVTARILLLNLDINFYIFIRKLAGKNLHAERNERFCLSWLVSANSANQSSNKEQRFKIPIPFEVKRSIDIDAG